MRTFAIVVVVVLTAGCGKKNPAPGDGSPGSGDGSERPVPARDATADAAAATVRAARLAELRPIEAQVAAAVRARQSNTASSIPERVGFVKFVDKDFHATAAYASPDPTRVAVRLSDAKATRYQVYDLLAGAEVCRFDAPGSNRPQAAFSPDGAAFAAGGWDNKITVWDAKTGRVRKQFPTGKPVWFLTYASDGSGLVASLGGTLVLLDTETGETRRTFGGDGLNAGNPAVSPDGKVLAAVTTGKNNRVGLWDFSTGTRLNSTDGEDSASIGRLVFAPDGRSLVLTRRDQVVVRDVATGAEKAASAGDDPVASPDGRLLAYGRTSKLVVRDLGAGTERVTGQSWDPVGKPFFFPGGTLIGTLANDALSVWDVEACRPK